MSSKQTLNEKIAADINKLLTDLQVTFQVKKKEDKTDVTKMKGTVAIEDHILSSSNRMEGFYNLFCYTEAGQFSVDLANQSLVNVTMSEKIVVLESKGFLYTLLIE